jgi:hypothetical protein
MLMLSYVPDWKAYSQNGSPGQNVEFESSVEYKAIFEMAIGQAGPGGVFDET